MQSAICLTIFLAHISIILVCAEDSFNPIILVPNEKLVLVRRNIIHFSESLVSLSRDKISLNCVFFLPCPGVSRTIIYEGNGKVLYNESSHDGDWVETELTLPSSTLMNVTSKCGKNAAFSCELNNKRRKHLDKPGTSEPRQHVDSLDGEELTDYPIINDIWSEEPTSGDECSCLLQYPKVNIRSALNVSKIFEDTGTTKPVELGIAPWIGIAQLHIDSSVRDREKLDKMEWYCTAVLVTNQFVLTTAQCFHQPQPFLNITSISIMFGTNYFQANGFNEHVSGYKFYATDYFIHDEYDPVMNTNDIAAIKLKGSIKPNSLIRPVCIPNGNLLLLEESDYVTLYGWKSGILQEMDVSLITQDSCMKSYPEAIIDQKKMCVSVSARQNECLNDIGHALVFQTSTKHSYLLGMFLEQFGRPCGSLPSIFTKVTAYRTWIHQMIGTTVCPE